MTSKKIDYLDFFKTIGKSKRLLRTGWVREKIKDPESVAEHSFRAGVIAMVLSDKLGKNLNKKKLIKMALLVGIGELITGDIVVERGEHIDIKKREEMERQEKEDVGKIFAKIGDSENYSAVYKEMVDRVTLESRVFWQLDRLEMAIQALEYEEEQDKKLDEFFVNADLYIQEPLIRGIFNDIIKSRRKEYQESLRKKLKGKV